MTRIRRTAAVLAALTLLAWAAPSPADPIHDAAMDGNIDAVKQLLKGDPELVKAVEKAGKPSSWDGFTPLHWAALRGRKAVAEVLLDHKADPAAKDHAGQTPLHHAAAEGHADIVRVLLARKAPVKARDKAHLTPLHEAVWNGRTECAELLLDAGAEVDTLVAIGLGKRERVLAFLNRDEALVNARDGQGRELLHWAAAGGRKEIAELLLDRGAEVDPADRVRRFTPLHEAVARGHATVAELLLARGASVNAEDRWSCQPLHVAASRGDKVMLELLLRAKADVNAKQDDGSTALHEAARSGNKAAVEVLLQNGADVSATQDRVRRAPSQSGQERPTLSTPLHEAAAAGHQAVVELLLAHKADVNAKDQQGHTPLKLANANKHAAVAALLRERGGKE
jgi:ankyrin repeat protein